MNLKPELLCFDILGHAEPIRLLLEDVGVEYVDKQIAAEDWPEIQPTTPFRRMPVYREGDLEIPESFAIMSYLGRKHDLLGVNEMARVRCDVTIETWRDYGNRVANKFGALSKSETARNDFIEIEQPKLLSDLESFYLKRDLKSPYWAGNSPTVADFVTFHYVEGIANQFPELLRQFAALSEFHDHFSTRPNIKAYLSSTRRSAALFYGPNGKIFPR